MTKGRTVQSTRDHGRVYVLRVWRYGDRLTSPWHATLREDTRAEPHYFTSIDDCIEFLYSVLLRA